MMCTPAVVRRALASCPDPTLRAEAEAAFETFIIEHSERGLRVTRLKNERDDALSRKKHLDHEAIERAKAAAAEALDDLVRAHKTIGEGIKAAQSLSTQQPAQET